MEAAAKAEGASEEAKAKLTSKGSIDVSEVVKVAEAEWKKLDNKMKKLFKKQAARDEAAKLAAFPGGAIHLNTSSLPRCMRLKNGLPIQPDRENCKFVACDDSNAPYPPPLCRSHHIIFA